MDSPTPQMLKPGDTMGPYKIESLIGQGGMGEVYRGIDTRLGRPVAVKVSAKEFSDRFEREARAISSLNHPNICTLYDVGPNYLVMEFVEGETLSKLLKQGPLPLDKALQYAIQITDALSAAHAKGVIHRDLKPGNIILTKNGVKVLDFGLAKLSAATMAGDSNSSNVATLTEPITNKGAILGTLHYLSPEQAEGKEATERSDIFALGAVFYEMVAGKRAFQGETQTSILAAILRDQPAPVTQVQPLAPRTVDRVIRKCLAKDPDDRWQSARDLKPALELIDLDASATSVSGSQGAVAIPARRRWMWPAVAAAGVLVISGLAWALWPSAGPAGRVTRFEVTLPEGVQTSPGQFWVRVSPDGAKLAFTAIGEKGGIWVRDLEAVEARLLPGTAGASSPFWSPDSRSIAYGAGTRLMRVEVSGGPPQVLANSATPVGSGFWNEQGELVFGGLGSGPMQKVSQAGGVPTPVTALEEGEGFHSLPSPLPDGRHFIYFRAFNGNTGLYVGSLDVSPKDQSRKQVAPAQFGANFVRSGKSNGGNLFFLRDGTLMAQPFDTDKLELTGEPIPVAQKVGNGQSHGHFSVMPSGLLAYRTGQGQGTQMTWVDRKGKDAGVIGEPAISGRSLKLSPDESQVVVYRVNAAGGGGDLWELDAARNIETRFTFGLSASNNRPIWSPDGKQIAYRSKGQLMVKPASGAGDAQVVLEGDAAMIPTDWSHDGRFLIGMRPGGTYALPMKGTARDGEPAAVLQGGGQAVLSPDGRWIAYVSTESGRSEVYIQPFRPPDRQTAGTGAKWQVSRNGGLWPRWRGDGKELFFVTQDGPTVWAAEIEVAGDALRPAAPVALFQFPISGEQQWDASRDGRRFLALLPLGRGTASPITVVMNWQASLKR